MTKILLDKELNYLLKEYVLLIKKLNNEINYLIDNIHNLESLLDLHKERHANNCSIF
jgi:hypothetical protein